MKRIEKLYLLAYITAGNMNSHYLYSSIFGVGGGVDDERMFDKVMRPVV